MQSIFFASVIKVCLGNFENNFRNFISTEGQSGDHYWRVGKKKSMIFEVFGVYLRDFLIFLHEIVFGSKILSSSSDKYQKFDYGCTSYPKNETQSPDFGCFLTILGIF